MVSKLPLGVLGLILAGFPAWAQEESAVSAIGSDRFMRGDMVVVEETGIDDLFAAGSTVQVKSDIQGSGHLAGRRVEVSGAIGGDAYVAAMDIILEGRIAGDATLAGSDLTIGAVGGDLIAAAGTITVNGPISGYALLAGEDVRMESVFTGDIYLAAESVDFGEAARVDGRLILFEDELGTLDIPETIAPVERIERRSIDEWDDMRAELTGETWQTRLSAYLVGALTIAVLASLIAAFFPKSLANLRRGLLAQPMRNLWFGFLAQSVAVGSAIIFAVTLIGLLLMPVSLFIAVALGFAGYVVAVYAFGVGTLKRFGRAEPDSFGARVLAAGTGALVVGAIALIPFFGWLFVLALVLSGVGAITMKLFRPGFYVGEKAAA